MTFINFYVFFLISGIVDRESKDTYTFDIIIKDNVTTMDINNLTRKQKKYTSNVRVRITDVNDKPKFNRTSYTVSIPENAFVGSSVYRFSAIDDDLSSRGEVEYVAISMDTLFQLNHDTGVITTNGMLDYETKTRHTIKVEARDRGSPILSTEMTLHVDVTDTNDNSPKFERTIYKFEIVEGSTTWTKGGTVKASDHDGTLSNNKLTYLLENSDYPDVFTIDSDGNVLVNGKLDRESIDKYEFLLTATDSATSASERRMGSALLLINILDINDNPPVFSAATYNVSISGDTQVNTIITRLSTSDADLTTNAAVSYEIISGNDDGAFSINNDGDVSVRKTLNQTSLKYSLEIKASDGLLHRNAIVNINVTRPVHRKPVFDQSDYTVSFVESQAINQIITRVNATSNDQEAILIYSLVGKEATRKFTINSNTGVVKNKVPIVYEEKSVINFFIKVEDKAGNIDIAEVIVNVLNVNNEPPVFQTTTASVDLREDSPIGTYVISMSATDKNQLNYSIKKGNLGSKFTINQDGVITTKELLNYDINKDYEMEINASNGVSSSIAKLNVSVINTNTYKPIFSKSLYQVTLNESSETDRLVTTVKCEDLDEEGTLTYSIISKDAQKYFVVNTLGEIRNFVSLDYETFAKIEFVVLANDSVNIAVTQVEVTVLNLIDISVPEFSGPYTFAGPYTYGAGRTLTIVTARDRLPVVYSLHGHTDLFQIDPQTAEISLKNDLKDSQAKEYFIIVQAFNTIGRNSSTLVTLLFKLPPKVPSKPETPKVEKSTGTSVNVEINLDDIFGAQSSSVGAFDVYIQEYNKDNTGCK